MTSERARNVVTLSESQIAAAGELLARAFAKDPLAVFMLPDDNKRARLIPHHFAAFVRCAHLAGKVLATEGSLDGVAVWFPPGAGELTQELMDHSGISALPAIVGADAFARVMGVFGHFEELHKRDVPTPHWYLALIGVMPEKQGQGIAGSLLRPILEQSDMEALPCYLETVEPTNLPFYRKHGFEVVVDDIETESGVRYYTMLRQPQVRK